jgi:thymidine phosphorylase
MDPDLNTTELSVGNTGWVEGIDAMAIARVCLGLGAGRARLGDSVDHSVGAILEVQVGDRLEDGEPWMVLYHRDEVDRATIEGLLGSITLSDEEVRPESRIEEVFD